MDAAAAPESPGPPWPLRCCCGEPILLLDRTEHAEVMATGCCGARYQRQGPGRLSLLEAGDTGGEGRGETDDLTQS